MEQNINFIAPLLLHQKKQILDRIIAMILCYIFTLAPGSDSSLVTHNTVIFWKQANI